MLPYHNILSVCLLKAQPNLSTTPKVFIIFKLNEHSREGRGGMNISVDFLLFYMQLQSFSFQVGFSKFFSQFDNSPGPTSSEGEGSLCKMPSKGNPARFSRWNVSCS